MLRKSWGRKIKTVFATDAETIAGTIANKPTTPAGIAAVIEAVGITGLLTALVINKTDDYSILVDDLGKSFRMNSGDDKTFTSPSVGADEDGARITLVKEGTGKLTFQCADTDVVGDSAAGGAIYNEQAGETYATLTLEYVHAITKWVILGGDGTWTTT